MLMFLGQGIYYVARSLQTHDFQHSTNNLRENQDSVSVVRT